MLDKDSDGQSNAAEYIAGTNPSNGADVFKVLSHSRSATFALTIPGKGGRRYVLERSTQLTGASWSTIVTSATLSSDGPLLLTDPIPQLRPASTVCV